MLKHCLENSVESFQLFSTDWSAQMLIVIVDKTFEMPIECV